MINEINNIFNEIENNFNEFVNKQKNEKLKVTENLNKLLNLINFEYPNLLKEKEEINKNNENNLNSLKEILKEEINYSKNLIENYKQ